MKRAAIEKQRTFRTWKHHHDRHLKQNLIGGGHEPDKIGCRCDLQVNRFRKGQKRFGCGQPRCYLCHGEKLLGIPTVKDLQRDDAYRIGKDEL